MKSAELSLEHDSIGEWYEDAMCGLKEYSRKKQLLSVYLLPSNVYCLILWNMEERMGWAGLQEKDWLGGRQMPCARQGDL